MTTPIMNPPAVTVTYVGGPTVAIDICGMRFVTDPTFDAPGPYRSGTVDITKVEGPAIAVYAEAKRLAAGSLASGPLRAQRGPRPGGREGALELRDGV